jgi:hypothetical protein
LSHENLKALLIALEPIIDGGVHSDQAATASLALLSRREQDISELAGDREFASVKVLRVRDVRSGGPVALSLRELVARSEAGLLFANSPQANSVLPLLADALPEATPLIVEGKTAEFLKDSPNPIVRLHGVGNESILELVRGAPRFGTKDARRKLFERLRPTENDDRAALRCLCAGDKRAGYGVAKLYVLEGTPKGLERIVEAILTSTENDYLVPADIAGELTPKLREHIVIRALDTPLLAELLNGCAIADLQPTPEECVAFLLTELPDPLLRRLPIHARSDGTIGDAENVFREAEWRIPEALRPHVLTIIPCGNRRARERQEKLITAWSAQRQVEVALVRDDPHLFCGEILDALGKMEFPLDGGLLKVLRAMPWLLVGGHPVKPQDVFAVPSAIDEAARTLLMKNGETPSFFPAAKLSIEVREHLGVDFH